MSQYCIIIIIMAIIIIITIIIICIIIIYYKAIIFPKTLFSGKIPDIVVQQGKKLIVIELTCPDKTNLLSSREYKSDHYKELKNLSLVLCNDLELILLEISTLGFVSKHVREFKNFLNLFKCDTKRIMMCCSEVAIRCLYYIYCRRNKEWLTPEILKFVWMY